jgi:adenylate cyclase class IV
MTHEIETKIELSAQSFQDILSRSTVLDTIEQLNVYYDCMDAIATRSGSLRIRYVHAAAPVMTFKLPLDRAAGKRTSQEIEAQIEWQFPPRVLRHDMVPAVIGAALASVCVHAPRRLGAMRNRRSVVRLPGGDIVEMDEVTLPGGVMFYEVEIESASDAVHDSAVASIREIAGDCKWSERGKFQRFRAAIGRNA